MIAIAKQWERRNAVLDSHKAVSYTHLDVYKRQTLADLASEYGVHPTMISTWKQELVKRADELFERGNKNAADPQKVIDDLHRKIGQLQVERDFLVGQPAISRLMKGAR